MEELRPEELEELVQELEGESEEEEALSPEVEELLRDLQPDRRYAFRRRAAKELGEVSRSSRQVVEALVEAAQTDSAPAVRATAAESLRTPVHQEILQEYPDLIQRAQSATDQAATQREEQAAAAESAQQPELDLWEMAGGASVKRRIYPRLRIRESSLVARLVGIVIAVGSIAWIVAGALPAYKSDCCSRFFVTVVCGGSAYVGFAFMGLDPLEIILALLHCREWRGPRATTDGMIVDLESKEYRGENKTHRAYWITFDFPTTEGLVSLRTSVDEWRYGQLKRRQPVKVRYAQENPRLALLEWEE